MARDIIVIENQASIAEGELVKKILNKKFHLPNELIELRMTKLACEKNPEAIIHLCIEKNGELKIAKINQYVVKNSLGSFLNQGSAYAE